MKLLFFTPVGDGVKLTSDPVSQNFVSVDGQPGSPKHLFMFAHNKCSPGCCPSTYSSSGGCVCSTPEQRKWVAQTRAHNKNASDNFF